MGWAGWCAVHSITATGHGAGSCWVRVVPQQAAQQATTSHNRLQQTATGNNKPQLASLAALDCGAASRRVSVRPADLGPKTPRCPHATLIQPSRHPHAAVAPPSRYDRLGGLSAGRRTACDQTACDRAAGWCAGHSVTVTDHGAGSCRVAVDPGNRKQAPKKPQQAATSRQQAAKNRNKPQQLTQ